MSVSLGAVDKRHTRELRARDGAGRMRVITVPVSVNLTDVPALDDMHPDAVNWNNDNARLVFGLLGLISDNDDGLCGECELPKFRRAIVRARALFDKRAPRFTREAETGRGARGCRYFMGGCSVEQLRQKVDQAERFALAVEKRGATHVTWG